ncbi:MAG: hypothetical protein AAFO29_04955 [Actinomycetota bacterium]
MFRLRLAGALLAAILIATLFPAAADAGGRSHPRTATSEVDFGPCVELSTGTTVALSELQERVPESVPVLSLTEQGIVFPGSDQLGILITRTLECASITVTRDGRTRTQHDRHIAHVGTPVDTSVLPATPFNNDGANGADFNNYIFAYYSDSWIYRDAMRRAGVQPIGAARIRVDDHTVDTCVLDRTVTVRPFTRRSKDYGFTATGIIPDASCEPAVVPFIANWWSANRGQASVLSNNIPGQSAIFIDPAETVITIDPGRRSQLNDVFGADTATADAFGVIGAIPEADGTDMVITPAGKVGGPAAGLTFTLQNYFATPDPSTGDTVFIPFFDPIEATVGPGQEVGPYLYTFDITATAIEMAWDTTPDDELPPGAEPNDIYPPFVGSISGITQEQAAAAGIADEYWFDFDQDLTGVTFTVDTTKTLVPEVRIEDGDTLVISVPGGTEIGNGFDARILFAAE